jgi:hypothetical protein
MVRQDTRAGAVPTRATGGQGPGHKGQEDMRHTGVAQFIAACRRSKKMAMGLRRHRNGARLCRRCALPQSRETPRLRQILHAPKCDPLSEHHWLHIGSL